ncbi:hypothetical protein PRIPAC_95044 [Pristionchus pacificus]|uniref:Uncharacterized protein n=1 Tax=Pristionchus pacificus TaxID=54126 RepID=A0A2A6CIN0_PRIPA|nr:hypothetical protein PRIPAC_95044 [Pristionchus pacificus]|eukprot:PDM77913.1 hypothetical protein PRIPAC_34780 [Pristionchus pacificus]
MYELERDRTHTLLLLTLLSYHYTTEPVERGVLGCSDRRAQRHKTDDIIIGQASGLSIHISIGTLLERGISGAKSCHSAMFTSKHYQITLMVESDSDSMRYCGSQGSLVPGRFIFDYKSKLLITKPVAPAARVLVQPVDRAQQVRVRLQFAIRRRPSIVITSSRNAPYSPPSTTYRTSSEYVSSCSTAVFVCAFHSSSP